MKKISEFVDKMKDSNWDTVNIEPYWYMEIGSADYGIVNYRCKLENDSGKIKIDMPVATNYFQESSGAENQLRVIAESLSGYMQEEGFKTYVKEPHKALAHLSLNRYPTWENYRIIKSHLDDNQTGRILRDIKPRDIAIG